MFFPGGGETEATDEMLISNSEELFEATLRGYQPEVLVTSWSSPAVREEWLEEMPFLRYVCHTSGSVRHVVPKAFLERGGVVTNWGVLAAQSVAEHALLLILAGLRRLPEWSPVIMRKRPWYPSRISTRTFSGRRLGIHGFGRVARALVALCQPFGVSMAAHTTGVPEESYRELGVKYCNSLEELFSTSDILVECEGLTPHTRGMVTHELLEKLPQGALFVNVGRGAVVEEQALADLAQRGHLQIALDVFTNEPFPLDSPLHAVDGALFSPHIAGPTTDQLVRCGDLARKNLQAYFNGQPLEAVVTLEAYDYAT